MIGANVTSIAVYQRLVGRKWTKREIHVFLCAEASEGRKDWSFTITPAQLAILSQNIEEAVLAGNGYVIPETTPGLIGWAWYRGLIE